MLNMNYQTGFQQVYLDRLVTLLQSSQSNDPQEQKQVFQALKEVQQHPNIYVYMLKIITTTQYSETLREIASLTLKNIIKRNQSTLQQQSVVYIKKTIIHNFDQSCPRIFKSMGLVLSILMETSGVDYEVLQFLVVRIQQGSVICLQCVGRIIEDLRTNSENTNIFNQKQFSMFLEKLLNILLPMCQLQNKSQVLHCLNLLIYPLPIPLLPYLRDYVQVLYSQLNNTDPQILLRAMQGLEAISETRKDLLADEIIQRVAQSNFQDDKLKRAEVNFWTEIIDSDECEGLEKHLPVLLKKWIYGLEFTHEDQASIIQNTTYVSDRSNQQNEGQDDQQEQDFFGNGGSHTLRKRCGVVIGKAAPHFSQILWEASRGIVANLFSDKKWESCQIAILYIGLIAEYTKQQISSNFEQLISYIYAGLGVFGESATLKSTALWTISQYIQQLLIVSDKKPMYLQNFLVLVLSSMNDSASNVRQSSCTALSKILKQAVDKLGGALEQIVLALRNCLAVYKNQSLYNLYELIATFAEVIPKNIVTKELVQFLLIPLCNKWSQIEDGDKDLCPLLECLVTFCEEFRPFFHPYCVPLYEKSRSLLTPKYKQQLLRIMDLISAMLQTKNADLFSKVQQSNLISTLLEFLKQSDSQIKQFAYSLLNDIVKHLGVTNVQSILQTVAGTLDRKNQALANNALFCLMEIMSKYPQVGQTYVYEIYKIALSFLRKKQLPKIYQVNFAKLIGRLALINPTVIAPELKSFSRQFCFCLKSKYVDDNMNLAYKGFFELAKLNTAAVIDQFEYLVDSFLFFTAPNAQNEQTFKELLTYFKSTLGTQDWERFLDKKIFLPAAVSRINQYLLS